MYLVFGVGALFAREKCKLWQRSTVVSSREEGTPGLGASHLPLICLTAHELGAPGQPGRRERPCVLVGRGGTVRILSRVFEGSGRCSYPGMPGGRVHGRSNRLGAGDLQPNLEPPPSLENTTVERCHSLHFSRAVMPDPFKHFLV